VKTWLNRKEKKRKEKKRKEKNPMTTMYINGCFFFFFSSLFVVGFS
jgi:hypothetical protein